MHITDLGGWKYVVTGVDRDEGNSPRLKVLGTRTPNWRVVILSYQAVR
jgi:hypothetical protein